MSGVAIDWPRFPRPENRTQLKKKYHNILFFPGVRCATATQKAKTFIHTVITQQKHDAVITLPSVQALIGYLNVAPADLEHALEELKSWGYAYDIMSEDEPILVWDELEKVV
ncbi:MAG: hypothetical protein AB7P76_06060 [Candidatus Melainabacteria bacterium]